MVIDDAPTLSALRAAVPAIAGTLELWSGRQPLFAAEGIDEAIEAALSAQVPLPSGGRLTIEETEALVAIDVDSGATPAPSPRAAALACDLEAAAEIGRHIRLRDLAGTIVIDFVPLRRPAERERVFRALQDALEGDDRRLRIGGWTRLGLLELVRERRGPSLLRQRLTVPCTACAGGDRSPIRAGSRARRCGRSPRRGGSPAAALLCSSYRRRLRQCSTEASLRPAAPSKNASALPSRCARMRRLRQAPSASPTRRSGGERRAGKPATSPKRLCPICGKPAAARFRPFCSQRCADIDLGRWLGEVYRIPAENDEEDHDDGSPPDDERSPIRTLTQSEHPASPAGDGRTYQ
ncbi:MAG: DNA gyrase inhibitor YacG [Rhodospirillales bacterium]